MTAPTGWTLFLANNIQDASGKLLAQGTLELLPTDATNRPVTVTVGSANGGAILTQPAPLPVFAGSVGPANLALGQQWRGQFNAAYLGGYSIGDVVEASSLFYVSAATFNSDVVGSSAKWTALPNQLPPIVPDTALTKPANAALRVTVRDSTGTEVFRVPFVYPTGASFNFDMFEPNVGSQAVVQTGPQGLIGPAGAPGVSIYSSNFNLANVGVIAPAAASQNPLTVQANAVIDANHQLFTDGTDYWSAGPAYASNGHYIDDGTLTMLANPAKFTAAQVLNIAAKFYAARNTAGEFPIAILPSGAASVYYSAWDQAHLHATGDGWIMFPQLLHLYWQKTGDLTYYNEWVAGIKTALATIPRNASNHLLTVIPGAEYICGLAFAEYMRNTGDVAAGNVWYCRVCQVMKEMASAAGDTANITFFGTELTNVVAGIQSTLIDSGTGLLIAATGQNSSNLDVVSSSVACFFELLTTAQESKIATYFQSNYSNLVNGSGYLLQSPTPWSVVGYIPSSGGAPYGASSFTASQYQGGYWSHHVAWFAYTLAKVSLAKVGVLLTAFLNGVDPATEWYNRGSAVPQGTTPNLESPQGAKLAMDMFPSVIQVAPGVAFVNQYGGLVQPSTGTGISLTGLLQMIQGGTPSTGVGAGRHVLSINSASTEVLDIINTDKAGPSAIGFNDYTGTSQAGFGYANSLFSLTYLQNKAYFFGVNGVVITGNVASGPAVTVGTDNGVTIAQGLGVTGSVILNGGSSLYGVGQSGSGMLTLWMLNCVTTPAGIEQLIDTTQPAVRMAMVLPSSVIIQTAPAGSTPGNVLWTTVKTLN